MRKISKGLVARVGAGRGRRKRRRGAASRFERFHQAPARPKDPALGHGGEGAPCEARRRSRARLRRSKPRSRFPILSQQADALRPLMTEADRRLQRDFAAKLLVKLKEARQESCGDKKDKALEACLKKKLTKDEIDAATREVYKADGVLELYVSNRERHQKYLQDKLQEGKLWVGLKLEPWEVPDGAAPPGALGYRDRRAKGARRQGRRVSRHQIRLRKQGWPRSSRAGKRRPRRRRARDRCGEGRPPARDDGVGQGRRQGPGARRERQDRRDQGRHWCCARRPSTPTA